MAAREAVSFRMHKVGRDRLRLELGGKVEDLGGQVPEEGDMIRAAIRYVLNNREAKNTVAKMLLDDQQKAAV
jgi:hypothetical protein